MVLKWLIVLEKALVAWGSLGKRSEVVWATVRGGLEFQES